MSEDGAYILRYQFGNDPRIERFPDGETAFEKDKKYIESKHGGELVQIDNYNWYYQKPKYRLTDEDLEQVKADQVLESTSSKEWWKDVTNYRKIFN